MEREKSGLLKKFVRAGIVFVIAACFVGAGYTGLRGSVAGGRVTELFNEKVNRDYHLSAEEKRKYTPDRIEMSLACKDAGIPYDCTNPRELTVDEKKEYLWTVHKISFDSWGNVIKE